MTDPGYVNIRLPADLAARIDQLSALAHDGVTSRNAFVAEAVRLHLERREEAWMAREAFFKRVKEEEALEFSFLKRSRSSK